MLGPLLYGEGVTKPFGLDSFSDFLFLPWANPRYRSSVSQAQKARMDLETLPEPIEDDLPLPV